MSNPARSFRVTLVSPDTAILHDLAWMLTAVGYSVATSRDTSEGAAWRHYDDADIVVFDGRSVASPTPATLAHNSENPLYRLFLYDPTGSADLAAWFAAGANDALRVPISRGELLARLRVGARWLEFENRLRSQSSRSRVNELYSSRGLWRKLDQVAGDGDSITSRAVLLSTTIDFFAGFRREEGDAAGRSVQSALADAIQHCVSGKAYVGCGDDDVFHVLLPESKVAAARAVAEQIAERFRATQAGRQPRARLTVTTAVVPWRAGVRPEQLLEQGRETLAIGAQSGGDCVLEANAYEQEHSNWQTELTAGSPFANVIAQDIMEPFPALLEREAIDQPLLAALRRSEAPVWPFVDRQGRLVGVASPESEIDAIAAKGSREGIPALANPVTIPHDAAFPEIYDKFSTEGCLSMVVVADRRPIGYLTCGGFLSLIEPITSATFARQEPPGEDSLSLLVGSLVNEGEPACGSDR
jgi:GGDEF domain-containing protein